MAVAGAPQQAGEGVVGSIPANITFECVPGGPTEFDSPVQPHFS